jgi:hypothetical protein
MDAHTDRIGEHAAGHPPAWAIAALGPVPAHLAGRVARQNRAAAIGTWRELSDYDHCADPIGPEPVAAAPDACRLAPGAGRPPADGPDVRGMPDGRVRPAGGEVTAMTAIGVSGTGPRTYSG